MRKLFIIILLIFFSFDYLFPIRVLAAQEYSESRLEALLRTVARPRLIYPNDEEIYLKGKNFLRFQWGLSKKNFIGLNFIEFCIYKGKDILEKNLIFKKRLSPEEYTLEISSDLFKNGQLYTWGIRQYYLRAEKSNERYSFFKVYKTVLNKQ